MNRQCANGTSPLRLAAVSVLLFVAAAASTPYPQSLPAVQDAPAILEANNRGIAWMDQLKFEAASEDFRGLTRQFPNFAPGFVNLGIAEYYRRRYEESEAALRRALELAPDQPNALFVLGLIHRNRDETAQAIESFSRVLRQDPTDPATNYFIGTLERSRGNLDAAVQRLRICLERQPYNKSAVYNLAQALLRSGKRDEGREMLRRFQELEGRSGTDAIGLDYREQGEYAVALDRISSAFLPGTASDPSKERIDYRFEAKGEESAFPPAEAPSQPLSETRTFASRKDFESLVLPSLAGGISAGDFDGDGWIDLCIADPRSDHPRLYRNGGGRFTEVASALGIVSAERTIGALWGDFDNDGDLDLYLLNYGKNRLFRNDGARFADITDGAGVGDGGFAVAGAFLDYDHDGDLDLLVGNFSTPDTIPEQGSFPDDLPGAANRLYRNNGDGTFADVSQASGVGLGQDRTLAVRAWDYNDSRDIDIYVRNWGGRDQLLSNRRDGTFEDVTSSAGLAAIADQDGPLAIADFDRDGTLDLMSGDRQGRLGLWKNGHAAEVSAPRILGNLLAADFNNDGAADLLIGGSNAAAAKGIHLLESDRGSFRDASQERGLGATSSQTIGGAAAADFDNDGDLDIVAFTLGGPPQLWINQGGNQNHWIAFELKGASSNRGGVGAKVEVRSGGLHLKSETYASAGWQPQTSGRIHFGIGKRQRVDFVRITWPSGVLQSEVGLAAQQTHPVEELDRKGTSCPILYLWDGERYVFQTDFLGGSALGYFLAPGLYNTPDSDEFIRLDRERLQLRDGRVAVTLNNQLEEVIYFDSAQLLVVDHPADFEVIPNERLLPAPPYDDLRLLTRAQAVPPSSAEDGRGQDLLDSIRDRDRLYADVVRPLPFKGYAEPHEIRLGLDGLDPGRLRLFAWAWIDYADSSSNRAAGQAGLALHPPRLEAYTPEAGWRTVIENLGFPAGMPKWMAVDLSGKVPVGATRLRIVTNMCIYWDQILLDASPQRGDIRRYQLPPASADLHFHGFPEFSSPDGRLPRVYFHDRVSPIGGWKVHRGNYTAFGDVVDLLGSKDDRLVVTRSGDEIELTFDTAGLPAPPDGWVRDYILQADGFGKDMDLNSAGPDTVEPLPFHDMPSYPYPWASPHPEDSPRRTRRHF